MQYAAPIQGPAEDDWLQPALLDVPLSALPTWAAPIIVDDRDEAWNERAFADMLAGGDGTRPGYTPLIVRHAINVPGIAEAVAVVGPVAAVYVPSAPFVAGGPGDPVYDYLAGTADSLPHGWPGEPTDVQLAAHAAQAAAELDAHGDDVATALGHPDADAMRTAIADAETQLATGYALGNGPLTDDARAALAAVAAPPGWATQIDRATPFREWPTDGPRWPSEVVDLRAVVVEQATAAGVDPPAAVARAEQIGLVPAVPGRIEPVRFEPVRFAAPVVVRDGEVVPPSLVKKRAAMIAVVQAYAKADPRSNQVEIGPSEIGDPCDSRVMRRALGFPAVAWPDPWASFVGTAVHAKLADAFAAHNAAEGRERYLLERRVWMTDGMSGSTDLAELLSTTEAEVVDGHTVDIYDHKVLGTDTMREQKKLKLDPASKYGVQLDTYAYGWRRAGFTVRTINIALWPRSGFLDGLVVFERPPDYGNAEAAIDRVSTLRQWALERGADEADEPWQDVATAPGKGCGFCSYYNPHQPLSRFSCDKGRDFMAGARAGTGPRGTQP